LDSALDGSTLGSDQSPPTSPTSPYSPNNPNDPTTTTTSTEKKKKKKRGLGWGSIKKTMKFSAFKSSPKNDGVSSKKDDPASPSPTPTPFPKTQDDDNNSETSYNSSELGSKEIEIIEHHRSMSMDSLSLQSVDHYHKNNEENARNPIIETFRYGDHDGNDGGDGDGAWGIVLQQTDMMDFDDLGDMLEYAVEEEDLDMAKMER